MGLQSYQLKHLLCRGVFYKKHLLLNLAGFLKHELNACILLRYKSPYALSVVQIKDNIFQRVHCHSKCREGCFCFSSKVLNCRHLAGLQVVKQYYMSVPHSGQSHFSKHFYSIPPVWLCYNHLL